MPVDVANIESQTIDITVLNQTKWFPFHKSSVGSIQLVGSATGYVLTLLRSNDGVAGEALPGGETLTPSVKFASFDCSYFKFLGVKVTTTGTGAAPTLIPCGKSDVGGY